MAFRDRTTSASAPEPFLAADPFARFQELYAALTPGRGVFNDTAPLRLAAINLVTCPGDPTALAATFYARDEALRRRLGWLSDTNPAVRRVLASQLVKYGDDPDAFLDEVERVRALFRDQGLRRGGVFETLSVLVLRRCLGGAAIEAAHVARLGRLYAAMKSHHWWLTGPEDFPACAMLVAAEGEPEAIGAGIEAIYQALQTRAALWAGDPLQTAANVLYLSGADPLEIAGRFASLAEQFRGAGAKIGQPEYDDLAVLCFLALPSERIVASVMDIRGRLAAGKWFTDRGDFGLASNLAFVALIGNDDARGPLADAKLLLDMQMIVVARQAATSAAVAASTSAG